jgi:HlyD family secretion protein
VQNNLSHVRTDSQKSVTLARQQEQQATNQCNSAATPTPHCVQVAQAQYNQAVAQANTNITSTQATVTNDQRQLQLTQAQTTSDVANAQSQVTTAENQLSVAQANAAAQNNTAQGQVNTAESQLTTAEANATSQNTSAQGQVNTAESQLTTAEANAASQNAAAQSQVATAQAQFNTAQVQLQTAQHNLENSILKAPHDGVISEINGTVGGTPGVPADSNASVAAAGSTFVQIVDLSTLQVQANVNESDTGNLHVGQPAQFTVSAFGEKLFRGTVSAIAPNGETVSNVVTYPVTIDVDMNSLRGSTLLPGMTANVTITVVQHPDVLLLPVNAINVARTATTITNGNSVLITKDVEASALAQARQMLRELQMEHPDGSADNAIPAVVLERSGDQFIVKPVVLGLTDETVYEVLAGLSANETVLVSIQRGR